MWRVSVLGLFVVLVAMQISCSSSVKCDGRLCKSGECDEDGQCICKLPDPSTILDGDRPFLGGKHCDEERIMCDGTNSFWCEHGGVCEEIIQGENYTCKCPPGYIGEHCEHSGVPCGSMFCFHRAECIIEDRECACPHNWRGSVDCAFPTKPKHSLNDTTPNFEGTHNGGGGNEVSRWRLPSSKDLQVGRLSLRKIKPDQGRSPPRRSSKDKGDLLQPSIDKDDLLRSNIDKDGFLRTNIIKGYLFQSSIPRRGTSTSCKSETKEVRAKGSLKKQIVPDELIKASFSTTSS
ncbi:uncharacterized protein LOC131038953 isoform X1 [Cryptomeria japonica]|uniref:uncharacterized protein LOC131038953 isoform X1 n=1 Tax=Cryptomeria japonica TaxID=3369 RepID=UPI0027D9E32B|nr:uncharacterized protein LOC131038953 isoform X1 [Cryptomeria japonica]